MLLSQKFPVYSKLSHTYAHINIVINNLWWSEFYPGQHRFVYGGIYGYGGAAEGTWCLDPQVRNNAARQQDSSPTGYQCFCASHPKTHRQVCLKSDKLHYCCQTVMELFLCQWRREKGRADGWGQPFLFLSALGTQIVGTCLRNDWMMSLMQTPQKS